MVINSAMTSWTTQTIKKDRAVFPIFKRDTRYDRDRAQIFVFGHGRNMIIASMSSRNFGDIVGPWVASWP